MRRFGWFWYLICALQGGCVGGVIGVALAWGWNARPVSWWEIPCLLFGIVCNFGSFHLIGAGPFWKPHSSWPVTKEEK